MVSMSYFSELTRAMTWLGEKEDTIFLGQSVVYPGNALYKTLEGVPAEKRIEMPVAEDMQLGLSLGLALTGKVPITIFPRLDFMMCCMNQLVNHLDKGYYHGKVIIRTCVGATKPLYPGAQHCGDYPIENLLQYVDVYRLLEPEDIFSTYTWAYSQQYSLIIEYGDFYSKGNM